MLDIEIGTQYISMACPLFVDFIRSIKRTYNNRRKHILDKCIHQQNNDVFVHFLLMVESIAIRRVVMCVLCMKLT